MDKHSGHLDALTGIRGLAAWGVVLYHIRLSLVALLPAPVIALFAKGYLAVDLFFILSGFVIWHNYAGRIAANLKAGVRLFLWRRFARVWPLHGLMLLGFCGYVALLAMTGRSTVGYPLAELPLHVLLVQNWGMTHALSWNHPAWSISTEFAAYLIFPLLVLGHKRLPEWLGWIIALVLLLFLALHRLYAGLGHDQLGQDITGLSIWRCLIEFTLGCGLWLLWDHYAKRRHAALYAYTLAGLIAVLGWYGQVAETALVPALFFSFLLGLALDRGWLARLFASKGLTYLGEISYATYLSHFLLFILFKLAFVDASLQLGWAGLAGFLALVLTASVGLYHGFEKPAQRWLNRLYVHS